MNLIWHLINDPDPRRGGAQRVLSLLLGENDRVLSLLSGRNKTVRALRSLIYLAIAYFREKPSVVVVHSRIFLPLSLPFRLTGAKVYFYCHANYQKLNWLFLLLRCNGYIAVSYAVADNLINIGIDPNKITVIRNPYLGPYESNLTETSNLTGLGYVGALQEWKGIRKFLDTLKFSAFQYKEPTKFIIIGDGPQKRIIEQFSGSSQNLSIEALGYKEFPFNELTKVPIVIVPSLEEGFGLVAIEAIYNNKIVLYNSVPALVEVCSGDPLCLEFRIDDPESIKKAMSKALTLIPKLSENGMRETRRRRIDSSFGLARFKAEYKTFLSQVISVK